jgi:hypothetical protein
MPRGGLLNAMTMADAKAVPVAAAASAVLAPPRRKSRAVATTATIADVKRKSGFPMFLLAILMAAGFLALLGWQSSPWKLPGSQPNDTGEQQTAATPKQEPPPPTAPPVTAPVTTPAPAPAPQDAKPSPVGQAQSPVNPEPEAAKPSAPAPTTPPAKVERRAPAPLETAGPQEVMFMTSPGGATATLDGNPAMACSTPCSLSAAPGRHALSIVLPGYQIERREFMVGTRPLELPPIVMQAAGGTLMLSSDPPGAAISINGKRIDKVTPAQISLGLGVYSITVEKGGRQTTEKVEINSGITQRKLILGQ